MKQAAASLSILLITSWTAIAAPTASAINHSKPVTQKNRPIPAESLYQMLAAELAIKRTQPDVALANYIAAAKQTQDPNVAKRATEIALSTASLEIALEPAALWAKLAQKNLEAQITMAAIHLRLLQASKAVPFLTQLQIINPTQAHQHFLLLNQQLPDKEERAELIKALDLMTKKKSSYSAELALGEILLSGAKPQEALVYSRKALRKNPNAIDSIQLYSKNLVALQQVPKAKSFLDKMAKRTDRLDINSYYLQFLVNQQFDAEGKKVLRKISSDFKLKPSETLQLAKFSMQAEWYDESSTLLKTLKQHSESKDIAHYFLARIAEIEQKPKEAIEWFKQVLTGPFHVLSQVRASVLLSQDKQYDEALIVLSRAQSQNANDKKRLLMTEIEILNQSKQAIKALDKLNTAVKLAPNDLELRYARSLVSTQLNKLDLAETDLKHILVQYPNHVDALNALGYLLTNHTKRYTEAHEHLTRALKLSPNNPTILDSMGWLEYKMGKMDKALSSLQQASRIVPDPEIAAHLGEVLWKMKNFKAAKEIWNQALIISPNNPYILNTMERLID
tara:strand:- start:7261 stop:8952 length:1692 start_codon:yes stop_codon:yes gene_type:complete